MKLSKQKAQKHTKVADKTLQPSAKNRHGAALIFLFCIILSFALPIAAITFVVNDHYVTKNNANIAKRTANFYSKLQVTTVNRLIMQYNERLRYISNLSSLNTLLSNATHYTDKPLVSLANELLAMFPQAKSLRFIPRGSINEVETDGEFPIRYAGLDLIRTTLKGKQPLQEAIKIQDQWYAVMTHPIYQTDRPLGVIYLIVGIDEISQALTQNTQGIGQTQLIQQYDDKSKPQTFMSMGNGNDKQYTSTSRVDNSIWSVKFTPSSQYLTKINSDNQTLFIAIASGIGFFIIVFTIAYLQFTRSLTKNLTQLNVFLEELINGNGPRSPVFSFPQIQQIMTNIIALKPRSAKEIDLIQAAFGGDQQTEKNTTGETAPDNASQKDQSALNIELVNGDQDELGLANIANENKKDNDIFSTIYRAYDIRGIASTQLTDAYVVSIGKAIGSLALDATQTSIVVGADGRNSSPAISENLIKGILSTGCNVIDIGTVPSPILYFATHTLDTQSGVIVTASHNSAEYNGMKIVINGESLFDNKILAIKKRIDSENFHHGEGSYTEVSVTAGYIERICSDVALGKAIKLVIDCGNSVTGNIAPKLFTELGCEVIPLYCDVDGNFPNHDPDPSVVTNLTDLIARVKEEQADLGIALDGDGDRIGLVTAQGNIIFPDRLMMLFAKDIVSRNPGADVLFDVKCTRRLNAVISTYGGRPVMWKTGHSFMKQKMVETGALLAGEFSGHIFFKERWYGFDDGLYAAARLLEILAIRDQDIDSVFNAFPQDVHTPEILVSVEEDKKFDIIDRLIQEGDFSDGKITTIDGVRIDFSDGWGLVRASNTNPAITMRFEAETEAGLERIQNTIRSQLLKIDSNLSWKNA